MEAAMSPLGVSESASSPPAYNKPMHTNTLGPNEPRCKLTAPFLEICITSVAGKGIK